MKNKKFILLIIVTITILATSCASANKGGSDLEFNQYLNEATRCYQKENYSLARQKLDLALQIDPNSVRANNMMGLAYFKEGNYALAETYFRKTVKLDPGYATGYLNLGAICAMKKLYSEAREYYEKAISISPNLTAAYYSLATVCFQLNDRDKGLSYLKRGFELDPNYLEEHREALSSLPMEGPALAQLYFSFAKVYASQGEVVKTAEYLKKARQNGFKNWKLIETEPEFVGVRDNPLIKEFLK
ncbi:MAG: tetratricopeptide repeat protein [Acidobacteriota bacterium]|nr:tetratricopeptide repeat protein [Acidobacteriota bacterium]